MPSKNIIKIDIAENYYHVYNRGVNKRAIFKDEKDYEVFFSLFKRYLSAETQYDFSKREYPNYHKDIELLAICLMPNHFHLLFYQKEQGAMSRLMKSVCTAYTMYFNKRHKRVGHLFQDHYKASLINDDAYLQHISRYIHLNCKKGWKYTSLPYYMSKQSADWLKPDKILALFDNDRADYKKFLNDYEDYKDSLADIEQEIGEL